MTRDELYARAALTRRTRNILVMASCGAVVPASVLPPETDLGVGATAPEYVPRSIRRFYKNVPTESPAGT